jgi:hypothetical protein
MLIIGFFLIFDKNKSANQFHEQSERISEATEENDLLVKYEISSTAIKLFNNDTSLSLRWKYFAGYTVFNNAIILLPKLGTYLDGIIFENDLGEFTYLEKIISSNLKKIHTFN